MLNIIADGSGSAVDESGLCHEELLRLVKQKRPIIDFSIAKISASGQLFGLDSEVGLLARNGLHFNVSSDVFVPAGGRPSTINSQNWPQFFEDGDRPVSSIVVEGANLFLDETARDELSQRGVTIVKDSSANKCGVICSSLEIIAGMVLSEQEFLAIKAEYVQEVLILLRGLAKSEAVCLFNQKLQSPEFTLPQLSAELSRQILRLGDIVSQDIARYSAEDFALANDLIMGYLPQSLTKRLKRDVLNLIPRTYLQQLVAALLSSRVVYREGLVGVKGLSRESLSNLALQHLRLERKTLQMVEQIKAQGLEDAELIVEILMHAGARAQRELGLASHD